MTTMKIEYIFDVLDLQKGMILDYVGSGIKITIDGIIITKSRSSVGEDNGYRGDYLVQVLTSWLRAVPKLLAGDPHETLFLDISETVDFTPRNGMIYVRFWEPEDPSWAGSDDECDRKRLEQYKEWNSSYPNYPDGTPVPPAVLVNEFIRVSEDFLAYIEPYDTKNDSDIADFREELKKAKDFWKNKSKEYPDNAGIPD